MRIIKEKRKWALLLILQPTMVERRRGHKTTKKEKGLREWGIKPQTRKPYLD